MPAGAAGDDAGLVVVVNSQVARGAVGGRASLFALERAGFETVLVPTVILAWHPGHGPSTRSVPPDFAGLIADIASAPWLPRVRAVLSGYLGAAAQAEPVARLVHAVRAARPEALYLCDPVIGDHRGLYVAPDIAAAIRDILVPLADVVTPNASELAWLTDREVGTPAPVVDAAHALGRPLAAVTSPPLGEGQTGAALVRASGAAQVARHPAVPQAPHGTGDLFAASLLAELVRGDDETTALRHATAVAYAAARAAAERGADELPLAADAAAILKPDLATVDLTTL